MKSKTNLMGKGVASEQKQRVRSPHAAWELEL
jgi:hypothetical protein